jgi:membrane-associated phospholipid phosphatase
VATVVARRHANHKWVPILAYSLATLDGISRISSNNHFLADTVFGGALGYAIGRYVVARQ